MAQLEAILGSEVHGKNGKKVPVSSLADNDLLGLYFSAHWCPPCRGFTPVLAECYKKVTGAGKKFEIVFVSFDKNQGDCNSYYDSMPWLLLPFDGTDLKEGLSDTYNVSGIPALIFINPKTGETITSKGRELVENDKNGDKFPWK